MGTGSFSGVKRPGRGVDHPNLSSAEVKERVELYFYSPSRCSWPVLGRPLPLPFTFLLFCFCSLSVLFLFCLRSFSVLSFFYYVSLLFLICVFFSVLILFCSCSVSLLFLFWFCQFSFDPALRFAFFSLKMEAVGSYQMPPHHIPQCP